MAQSIESEPDTELSALVAALEDSDDMYAVGAASRLAYLDSLSNRQDALTDKQLNAGKLLLHCFTTENPYSESVQQTLARTGLPAGTFHDVLFWADVRLNGVQ